MRRAPPAHPHRPSRSATASLVWQNAHAFWMGCNACRCAVFTRQSIPNQAMSLHRSALTRQVSRRQVLLAISQRRLVQQLRHHWDGVRQLDYRRGEGRLADGIQHMLKLLPTRNQKKRWERPQAPRQNRTQHAPLPCTARRPARPPPLHPPPSTMRLHHWGSHKHILPTSVMRRPLPSVPRSPPTLHQHMPSTGAQLGAVLVPPLQPSHPTNKEHYSRHLSNVPPRARCALCTAPPAPTSVVRSLARSSSSRTSCAS